MAPIDAYLDELLAPEPMPMPAAAVALQPLAAETASSDIDDATEAADGVNRDAMSFDADIATCVPTVVATDDATGDAMPADAEMTAGGAMAGDDSATAGVAASLHADSGAMDASATRAGAAAGDAPSPDADAAAREAIAMSLLAEIESDMGLTGAMAVAPPTAPSQARAVPVAPQAAGDAAIPASSAAPREVAALPQRMPAPAPSPARAVPSLANFMAADPIAPIPRTAAAPTGRARTATGGNRWLRVCVGGDSYGFELLRVQEVVRVSPVVAMRGAAHAVLGVMNLRGRIVPVFDLGLWLDVGAVCIDDRARVVVIERDDELIGVLVTCVEDVVSLEREHVEPPLMTADPGATLGVARVTNAPTVLLDADALFD